MTTRHQCYRTLSYVLEQIRNDIDQNNFKHKNFINRQEHTAPRSNQNNHTKTTLNYQLFHIFVYFYSHFLFVDRNKTQPAITQTRYPGQHHHRQACYHHTNQDGHHSGLQINHHLQHQHHLSRTRFPTRFHAPWELQQQPY